MNTTDRSTSTELVKLRDTGLALADDAQDLRGRAVVDEHANAIGRVSNLFIDVDERKVRMIEIHAGGFLGMGTEHVLLPVDAITTVAADRVTVNQTRERIAHAPAYDPHLLDAPTQDYWEPFYGYYGLTPYWNAGYTYPRFADPRDQISGDDALRARAR